MSTVIEVADRCYRDWLHAPEDQPVILALSAAATAAATSFSYDDSVLAPDEVDLLAPGVLVELDTELARVTAVDFDAGTLSVRRGVNGTSATSHAADAELRVAPTFARSSIVEAVKDSVVDLYPQLWQSASATLTAASGIVEVPAEVVGVDGFVIASGSSAGRPRAVEFLPHFPGSSTGKGVRIYGVSAGTEGYLTYRARFQRPSFGSDRLETYGVRPEWERIVGIAAAAQVVAGRDLDALTAEYITEQLQREALPNDAPQRIRNGLLTLRGIWLEQEHRSLRGDEPVPVLMQH